MNWRVFMTSKKSRLIVGSIVLFSSLLILGIILFSLKKDDDEPKKSISLYSIERPELLLFKGVVQARNQETILLDETSHVLVKTGDIVNEGDILFKYEKNIEAQEQLSNQTELQRQKNEQAYAQQDLELIRAKINETKNELHLLQEKEKQQKEKLALPNELTEEQIIEIQGELDNLNLKIEQNISQIDNYNETLISTARNLEQTNLSISSLQQRLQLQQEDSNVEVLAPISGIVELIRSSEVASNQSSITILSREVSILTLASEFDFGALKINKEVTILLLTSAEEHKGIITEIIQTPVASNQVNSGVSNYHFIVETDDFIQYGHNVQVKIEQENFIIPSTSVLEKSDQYFVLISENERITEKLIEGSFEGESFLVTAGLEENQKIIQSIDEWKEFEEKKNDSTKISK
jgi:multidrug efflux pump subunit AcrA (membrane-fusion protein)